MVEGKVLSNSSKLPLEGAFVELVGKSETTKTDRNGYFKVEKIVGVCFDPKVRITKDHYKPFEITFKSSRDSRIFEIRSQSDFITYDKPFYPDPNNTKTFMTGTHIDKYSKHFASDSNINRYYLDTIDIKKEIQDAQTVLRKRF
ncbi:MAG: hypothetical protein ABIS01_06835 [Ferruginibacter sp.]